MRRFDPLARGVLRWRPAEADGRQLGRPPGPQYAASAAFVLGEGAEVLLGWPDSADRFSIGINLRPAPQPEWESVEFDFLARDLVVDKVRPGAEILVTEGRHVVADLRVTEVLNES